MCVVRVRFTHFTSLVSRVGDHPALLSQPSPPRPVPPCCASTGLQQQQPCRPAPPGWLAADRTSCLHAYACERSARAPPQGGAARAAGLLCLLRCSSCMHAAPFSTQPFGPCRASPGCHILTPRSTFCRLLRFNDGLASMDLPQLCGGFVFHMCLVKKRALCRLRKKESTGCFLCARPTPLHTRRLSLSLGPGHVCSPFALPSSVLALLYACLSSISLSATPMPLPVHGRNLLLLPGRFSGKFARRACSRMRRRVLAVSGLSRASHLVIFLRTATDDDAANQAAARCCNLGLSVTLDAHTIDVSRGTARTARLQSSHQHTHQHHTHLMSPTPGSLLNASAW